ncbi:MAG: UV DNA damage repair endonuclease UvsE, partial [Kiritimatiellae bacterium]|nr:UV DNA damage repair endonuclease UvsE [Kiritimatiellia bacterium]
CLAYGIGSFRVNSQILPVKTHPTVGYAVKELPQADAIIADFKACGRFARRHGMRMTFHPDQFILLSATDPEITRKSVADLVYQAEVAEWVNADVINIHAGGAYGDKPAALARLAATLSTLPKNVRKRLTLENDDRVYTPADLLPFCRANGVPFVYDVHHHRCLPDGLTEDEVTRQAVATWNREPLFHVSTPRECYGTKNPRPHHDFINSADFPESWRGLDVTVEVEAKAKEAAVARLRRALERGGVALWGSVTT